MRRLEIFGFVITFEVNPIEANVACSAIIQIRNSECCQNIKFVCDETEQCSMSFPLDRPVTKNQCLNTKCFPKFLLSSLFKKKTG